MAIGIFFDCRYIRVDFHDGISRFSSGLFAALAQLTEVTAIISDKRQLEHLPSETKWVMLNDPTHFTEPFAALKLNGLGAKLVYSPMQTIGSFGRKFKLVLTLHDLIYYRHPTPPPNMPLAVRIGWRLFHLWYWPQRMLLNGADAVVTVSQTTAELMRQHRLTQRPVEVVYNAAGDLPQDYEHRPPARRPRDRQILVYMGSFMDYKNVSTLVRAVNELPEYELHLLSRIAPQAKQQLEALASPNGGKLVFHNGVTDTEYHEILDSAVALVHASHDEGFGIPLVESMARGIPIAVSDIPIFREIGGDAALYFDAENPAQLVEQLRALEIESTWLQYSASGIKRARDFSWAASAQELLRVIELV